MNFAASVYEHCAQLIHRTPWDVSRDAELLFQGQSKGFRLYRHAPVVVGVDIYNLEAEALGATVGQPAGDGIPAITHPRVDTLDELLALPPLDPRRGRIPMFLGVARRLAAAFPEADVRMPVAGPFSLATNLAGFDNLLCWTLTEPERTGQALLRLAQSQTGFCDAIRAAGLGLALFESAAAPPLLSPGAFRELELPALQHLLGYVARLTGRPAPCVIGGDTLPILASLMETGTRYIICPAETNQAAFMVAMRAWPDVMVRINLSPGIVAQGTPAQVDAEVDRVLRLATGRAQVCIGTGALPYETPPEQVLRIARRVAATSPA